MIATVVSLALLAPLQDLALRAALIAPPKCTDEWLASAKEKPWNAVVIVLDGSPAGDAAERVVRCGLELYYWIEVARNEAMASAHPEWMASLQGHAGWRQRFPGVSEPRSHEIVKCFPWVPVLYEEAFRAHLARVQNLLAGLPRPAGILLNDLQGPPSACGCGNVLCRWTADYGPLRTARAAPPDAAARFVVEVKQLQPQVAIVPVWATECEAADREHECNGVACFTGACWKEWTAQLAPVARACEQLAVLLPYRLLGRDDERHGGAPAAWLKDRIEAFATMPQANGAAAIAANRLIAVLQGWDVTDSQVEQQIEQTRATGARGFVLALQPIEQAFEPRVIEIR